MTETFRVATMERLIELAMNRIEPTGRPHAVRYRDSRHAFMVDESFEVYRFLDMNSDHVEPQLRRIIEAHKAHNVT